MIGREALSQAAEVSYDHAIVEELSVELDERRRTYTVNELEVGLIGNGESSLFKGLNDFYDLARNLAVIRDRFKEKHDALLFAFLAIP